MNDVSQYTNEHTQRAVVPRCFLALYKPGFAPRNEGTVGTPISAFADPQYCAQQPQELLNRIEQSLLALLRQALEVREPGKRHVLASASTCAIARARADGPLARLLEAHAKRYPNAALELGHLISLRNKLRFGANRLLQLGHLLDHAESQLEEPSAGRLIEALSEDLLGKLSALADGPAGEKVTPQEQRFGQLFARAFPGSANLRLALVKPECVTNNRRLSAEQLAQQLEHAETKTASEEIRDVARLLAKGRTQAERDADWFAQRYGVNGYAQSTLQAIGSAHSLTRERVRQVVDRLVRKLQGHTVYLPVTMNVLAAVDALLPKPEPELNALLAAQLGEKLEVASLFEFAVDIGALPVRTDLAFVRPRDDVRVAARRHSYTWAGACGILAGKMVSSVGAAQLHWLTGVLAQQGHLVTPEEVRGVASTRLGFEWLDEGGGWFWFGPDETRNSVINAVSKVLAIALRSVDCDELYAGLARSRRLKPRPNLPGELYIPPEVCQAILARTPLFHRSQQNNFALVKPLDAKEVLSDTEYLLFELMRERGGVASRHELHDIMVTREKVNFVTFSVAVDRSPILRNVDYGVYALVGWRIEPMAYERAWKLVGGQSGTGRRTAAIPDDNGWFRFETTLRKGVLENRQFTLPASFARGIPDGNYVLPEQWGRRIVKKTEDRLSGVVREALNAGWPVDTPLVVNLHPGRREAQISRSDGVDLAAPNTDSDNSR